MQHKLIIDGQLNNLNDYTAACRRNRFAGAKMKTDNEEIITQYILMQLHDVHFTQRVYIQFTWIEPNRKRDLDNVAFAKKFILDALVRNNVIENDGWKGVGGFEDKFAVDKENPRIEVIISDMEDINESAL